MNYNELELSPLADWIPPLKGLVTVFITSCRNYVVFLWITFVTAFQNPSCGLKVMVLTCNLRLTHLTLNCDFGLWPTCLNHAHDTSPHCSVHLCQSTSKSFRGFKSYDADTQLETNTFDFELWPWPLTHMPESCAWHIISLWWTFVQKHFKILQGV